MAEFICRLGTPAGEVVTRTVEASGVQEARVRLEREGFRVFNVTPPKTSGVAALTSFGRSGSHPRVKANDFLLFNQQLAALVRAGIPILQAISMLRKRAASARLRVVLGDVEEQIRGGAALSQAFASQGGIFPRIYTASILAGERSGALDEVLTRYVTYMRRNVALRRKIRGALAYPMFLLFASAGMVTFLTIYVVPRMSELFAGFGNELPTVTQIVVGLSRWLTMNIIWIGPLFIGGSIFLLLWSRTPNGKLQISRLILKIPLAGSLAVQLSVAQATTSLATPWRR
jgi:type IV pilus assembly protein PilC